ncbi:MAG: FHA domain-containing protein [Planctomycetota bacterium]|jgi:hypothetical protein
MEVHQTIAQFKKEFGDLPRDQFLENFAAPFLVVQYGCGGTKLNDVQAPEGGIPVWERTKWDTEGMGGRLQVVCVPLLKSDRNPDEEGITLGRIGENDIVVPHPSISKHHAVFRVDPDAKTTTIRDVQSTYGTTVQGESLEKNKETELENRTTIVFAGSVLATYFLPEAFYDFLNLGSQGE